MNRRQRHARILTDRLPALAWLLAWALAAATLWQWLGALR